MSYQETARFIKLPIDGYMDLLGITPNSSQNAIINAIINKFYLICGFPGTGKSTILMMPCIAP